MKQISFEPKMKDWRSIRQWDSLDEDEKGEEKEVMMDVTAVENEDDKTGVLFDQKTMWHTAKWAVGNF